MCIKCLNSASTLCTIEVFAVFFFFFNDLISIVLFDLKHSLYDNHCSQFSKHTALLPLGVCAHTHTQFHFLDDLVAPTYVWNS